MQVNEVLDQASNNLSVWLQPYGLSNEALQISERLKEPLILTVMGEYNAGKSTFINAILKRVLLRSEITPATAAITKLTYGEHEQLFVHKTNGTKEEYPIEKLEDLSAEGSDEGAQLRQNLSYIEVKLPEPLLQDFSIVDTPGLNAQHEAHTRVTEQFFTEVDCAIWLFHYRTTAKSTEIAVLKRLNQHITPLGVVNSIDEHDPEEEDFEEYLLSRKQALGTLVSDLIGVSALLALQGNLESDDGKMQQSRWHDMLQKLKGMVEGGRADLMKVQRFYVGLEHLCQRFGNVLKQGVAAHEEAQSLLSDYTAHKGMLKKQVDNLESMALRWLPAAEGKSASFPMNVSDWPIESTLFQPLRPLIEQHMFTCEEMDQEAEQMKDRRKLLDEQADELNRLNAQLSKDIKAWETSGLFGNRPIFDFGGKKSMLMARTEALQEDFNAHNLEIEELQSEWSRYLPRLDRVKHETKDLAAKVITCIREEAKQKTDAYNNKNDLQRAKEEIGKLSWVPDAQYTLHKKIIPMLNEMIARLAESLPLTEKIKTLHTKCLKELEGLYEEGAISIRYRELLEQIEEESRVKLSAPSLRIRRSGNTGKYWFRAIAISVVIGLGVWKGGYLFDAGSKIVQELSTNYFPKSDSKAAAKTTERPRMENLPKVKVTSEGANIRSKPSLNAEVVTSIKQNTELSRLEEAVDDENRLWYKVRTTDGVEGWLSSKTVQTLSP
jgi:GTPase SAR1 family protein